MDKNGILQKKNGIDNYHPPNIGMRPKGLAPIAVNSIHSALI